MNYRYDIQGLRAIAVLLVFIFHLNSNYLSGGFVGVDIFFVISGYLVSKIILHNMEFNPKGFSLFNFYIGRFKRLLPVYLVVLLLTMLIGSFIYLGIDINTLRKNVFWSSVFFSNYFLSTANDYFGAKSSENPLLHTWTLSIEMQFYMLLPIYLSIVKKRYLLTLTFILTIVLLFYSYYNSTFLQNKSGMYFSLFSRIPEFLIGIIFGIIGSNLSLRFKRFQNLIVWSAFILIIFSSLLFSEKLNFPGIIVLIPCLCTAIILCFENSNFNKYFLSNRILVHLGEISYSLYLWHWPVMAFLRYYNSHYEFTAFQTVFVIVTTYILSLLSYKYFETKFRKINNTQVFIYLGISSVILATVFFLTPTLNRINQNIPTIYIQPTFGVESHSKFFKNVELIGDLDRLPDSVLLIGDSHGLVYKSILDEIGKSEKFNFRTITNDLYPNIPGLIREDFPNSQLHSQYLNIVNATSKEIENAKIIMISSVWSNEIKGLSKAFDQFVQNLDPSKKVIVLSDFPVLDKNPIKINRSFLKNNSIKNEYIVTVNSLPKYVLDISNKYSNVDVLHLEYDSDLLKIPFNNDTIMYYDGSHLNDYGARILAKHLKDDFIRELKKEIKKSKVL